MPLDNDLKDGRMHCVTSIKELIRNGESRERAPILREEKYGTPEIPTKRLINFRSILNVFRLYEFLKISKLNAL